MESKHIQIKLSSKPKKNSETIKNVEFEIQKTI